MVALTKADLTDVREAYPALKTAFEAINVELRLLSSAIHEGDKELLMRSGRRSVATANQLELAQSMNALGRTAYVLGIT